MKVLGFMLEALAYGLCLYWYDWKLAAILAIAFTSHECFSEQKYKKS